MNKKLIVGIGLFIAVVSLVAYLFFYDDILDFFGGGNDEFDDDFDLGDGDLGGGLDGDLGDLGGLETTTTGQTAGGADAIEQPTSTEDPVEGSGAASAAANEAAGNT